jgi:non-heme chloroperoxidase
MARETPLRRAALGVALVLLACTGSPRPAANEAWTDPSPHRVSFVAVAPAVRLEVLDWGGSGPPLVFLAGLGDAAHVFDDFAPGFTSHFHVLAVTRRGYGASSRPADGYDIGTRVADLRAVLDSLGLSRVSLVGHSIAGDELTAFAAAYPARVAKLVYLDAAYDHSGLARRMEGFPPAPSMSAHDSSSPAAVQAYFLETFGMRLPEADIRATRDFAADGRLLRTVTPEAIAFEILRGAGHPHYADVRAPALAFYAPCDSTRIAYWGRLTSSQREEARSFLVRTAAWCAREQSSFRSGMRNGTVVLLSAANHYVFLCPVAAGSRRPCAAF